MSYSHEWRMHQHHFWGPRPLGPWGGTKRSNIITPELQSHFQRFYKPNFVILLTNERYITYQTGFSFGRLGHAQAWALGVPWGWGVKFFFPKFNQIWCVSYSHEWHMHRHNFCPPPPVALGRGQKFNFLNMVMWIINLKGMSSRPRCTE